MNDDRRNEIGDDPSRLEDVLKTFRYAAGLEPGVGLIWTVWGEVDGQYIQADGPTGVQAWYKAVDLVIEARRSKVAKDA